MGTGLKKRNILCSFILASALLMLSLTLAPQEASATLASFVKSVEYVEISLTTTGPTSANLTKGQTTDNCVPFVTRMSAGVEDYFDKLHTDIYFESGPKVTATRAVSGGTLSLGVYVVEFDSTKVKVQHGNISFSTTSQTPTITGVNQSKAALIFYYKNNPSNHDDFGACAVAGWFSADNQLTFQRDTADGTITGHYYVFEALNNEFSVQARNFTLSSTSNTVSINSVSTDKTFLIASYQSPYSESNARSFSSRIYLSSQTQITAERYYASSDGMNIRVFAITFAGDGTVQRGGFSYAASDGQEQYTLATAVSTDEAIAWNGVAMPGPGMMSSNTDSANYCDEAYQRLKIVSSGAIIQGDRGEYTAAATGRWEVISFIKFPSFEQEGFRFRNDDGSESGATWLAAQDTDITRGRNTNTRLRVLVNASLDPATQQFQLEYKKSTDSAWKKVETPSGSIGFGTAGTAATGSASLSVPYPASIAAGDLLVLSIANKYPTNGPSTPGGWTAPANNQGSGGKGTAGSDSGNVYATIFVKEADGTESGNLSVTITSGNSAVGRMFRYTKGAGKSWSYAATNGSDNDNSNTTWSVTGASDPGIAGGDIVIVASALNSDGAGLGSEALSSTGVTYGAMSERQDSGTSTGDDVRLVVSDHAVTSGTSSAVPVYTATTSSPSGNYYCGASVILRIRQIDAPIQLSLSSNFADGDSTGARLEAPSEKEGNFTPGKILESTNSAEVNIDNNYYTELEWCLKATDSAEASGVYQFRVTANGTALGTYSVTPQWTIGSLFTYRRPIVIDKTKLGPSCSSNLTNFPVLISLSGSWLRTRVNDPTYGHIENANGYDIIFRDSTGTIQLKHEIEKYDGSASGGSLIGWVKVPTIYKDSNTIIYMYYGNSVISSPTADPTNVWDSNYQAVYHLHGNVNDSTINARNGTDSSSGAVSGIAANGRSFDGNNDFINTNFSPSYGSGVGLTYEGWFSTTTKGSSSGDIAGIEDIGGGGDLSEIRLGLRDLTSSGSYNGYNIELRPDSGGIISEESSLSDVSNGEFHHLVLIRDGTTGKLYYDGNAVTLTDSSVGSGAMNFPVNLLIGAQFDTVTGGSAKRNYFKGTLDEIRISNMARTACWIETTRESVKNYSTFASPETEVTPAPTAVSLTSFIATQYEDGVLLKWQTGYEVDTLGFHVYREEKGQLYRLTPELVAGTALLAGSGVFLTGRNYSWFDLFALETRHSSLSTVRYWLEDIDLNGKRTRYGPAQVQSPACPTKLGERSGVISTESSAVSDQLSAKKIPKPELLSEIGMRVQEKYAEYWRIQELKERLRSASLKERFARGALTLEADASNLKAPRADPRGNEVSGPQGRQADLLSSGPEADRQEDLDTDHHSPLATRHSSLDTVMQRSLAERPAIKLLVKEEGWYHVTQPELVAAGLDPNVNPRKLHLYLGGKEQPIHVMGEKDGRFDPGDGIEFYGVGLDTLSTDLGVYWLIEGNVLGRRVQERGGWATGSAASGFPYTVEKKDRFFYFAALNNGEESNFFGPVVSATPLDQLLNVPYPHFGSSWEAVLEINLQGVTTGKHWVKVLFNGTDVGEMRFDGKTRGLLKLSIPQSLVLEGENLVTLRAQGEEVDINLVDTIRFTYWRGYQADEDTLKFSSQARKDLTLSGFSQPGIRVIDITHPEMILEVAGSVKAVGAGYSISINIPGLGRRKLLAFTGDRIKTVAAIIGNEPSSWYSGRKGYDLVILSHREFLESLEPLKSLRESQGLKVALVDVEDLYDEFSFGVKSPQAIKDFLSLGKRQWLKKSGYVLLVGDATFDPRNYMGFGDYDLVPTKLVDTSYIETASDDWFVDFNNDGLPDIAIGRLPVRTVDEANTVISKIIAYEQGLGGQMREALLIADMEDEEFNYEAASAELMPLLPQGITAWGIARGRYGNDREVRRDLLRSINLGPLLVNYMGHGSVEIWRGSVFTADDAERLTNGNRLPFFINMTCLNGFFQDVFADTLAESLLKAGQGGAVAVWASSGLTTPDLQTVLNKQLYRLLFNGERLTIGEATMRAKASADDSDVRRTWILFGDPSMRLRP